ncbi:DUF1851 domain-containing protein [Chitinophaga sp. SYP-B3965]|uniref:T6SS immunity protein Tdi1 domain-containing protein n=1 Tax=Chitinophaga sp. SYP-B3965 TaxID=2663120 RepID=UPI00129A07BD|nr:T6SS immunity protein Tdi1 domain-containing protein [Chitinophaga sp. SYP-B3965]MRG48402.1 DUF1851 domain-containing protein [Chitinophaga sp. SYP-B3965]
MKDFQLNHKPENILITKYEPLLPPKLIQLWQEHGFGSIAGGYLKIVNPADFEETLKEIYSPIFKNPIVMFATGMSDLIIWENNYTVLLNCRHGISKVIESGFNYFLEDIYDKEFIDEELEGGNYFKAKDKIAFDECYGYVPLLGSGGAEKVENLQKVKIKEHISIIAQTLGKIE